MSFESWLRQPTTIHGLGVLGAAVAGIGTQLLSGNVTASTGVGMAAYSAAHLLINDNSVDTDIAKLAQTAASAAGGPVDAATLAPALAGELLGLLRDATAPAAVTVNATVNAAGAPQAATS